MSALECKTNSIYLSTDSAATSGSPNNTYFDINSSVYGFATLKDNTAQYSYLPQDN